MISRACPQVRWNQVNDACKAKIRPTDVFLGRVYDVLVGDSEDPIISYALDKIRTPMDRDALVTFILSGATNKEIADALWIDPPEAVDVFALLYMDTSVFRDKMEHFRYAYGYVDAHPDSDKNLVADWIDYGIRQGPNALTIWWRRGYESTHVESSDLVNSITHMAYDKIMQARGTHVSAPASEDARKWVRVALDSIETRDGMDDGHNSALEAVLKITRKVRTVDPSELGIKVDDILH